MNKAFWKMISNVWSKKLGSENDERIDEAAQNDAKRDMKTTSHYSKNPLLDWGDDDDEF